MAFWSIARRSCCNDRKGLHSKRIGMKERVDTTIEIDSLRPVLFLRYRAGSVANLEDSASQGFT